MLALLLYPIVPLLSTILFRLFLYKHLDNKRWELLTFIFTGVVLFVFPFIVMHNMSAREWFYFQVGNVFSGIAVSFAIQIVLNALFLKKYRSGVAKKPE